MIKNVHKTLRTHSNVHKTARSWKTSAKIHAEKQTIQEPSLGTENRIQPVGVADAALFRLESESESVSVATTQPWHLSAGTGASLTGPTASPTPETRPATVESALTEIRSDAELQVPELEPRPELESIPIPVPTFSSFAAPASFLSLAGAADGKSRSDKKEAGAADDKKLFPPGFASWSKSQKSQASYTQRPELRPLHAVIPRAPDYLPE